MGQSFTVSPVVDINHSKIQASFDNGVLTLKLAKAEDTKPRKIDVEFRSFRAEYHPGGGRLRPPSEEGYLTNKLVNGEPSKVDAASCRFSLPTRQDAASTLAG